MTSKIQTAEALLTQVYQALGYQVRWKVLPPERALYEANAGMTDGDLFRNPSIETTYKNLVRVDVPVSLNDWVVYSRSVTFKITGWDSLRPYHIAAVHGVKFVETRLAGMKVEFVNTLDQAFGMLTLGRTDLVVDTREAWSHLPESERGTIKILEPPLEQAKAYHYLHQKHRQLALQVEQTLRKIANNQN